MPMKGNMDLVTGGSRGIGADTVKLLARHCAAVALNCFRSAQAAREVMSKIEAEGGTAIAGKTDVRNMDRTEAMVRKADRRWDPSTQSS